jgi:hypothetical protein
MVSSIRQQRERGANGYMLTNRAMDWRQFLGPGFNMVVRRDNLAKLQAKRLAIIDQRFRLQLERPAS